MKDLKQDLIDYAREHADDHSERSSVRTASVNDLIERSLTGGFEGSNKSTSWYIDLTLATTVSKNV